MDWNFERTVFINLQSQSDPPTTITSVGLKVQLT